MKLLEKAQSLPKTSGCYLMKNKGDEVIYVGKAKNLKNRVTSYFNNSSKSVKTQYLVSHIRDFEFMLTHSDTESYVLENNLIKKHSPKYNIRLRDDKSYPFIMVDYAQEFPRLEYTRKPKKGKQVKIYGPFPQGHLISQTLKTLQKAFQLRDCSLHEFNSRKKPCLLYQMSQCSAPCVDYIDQKEYLATLELAVGFFESKIKANRVLRYLESQMAKLAEYEEFEKAALIRDYLLGLKSYQDDLEKQNVEVPEYKKDVDVWAYFQGTEETDLSLYSVRKGRLIGQKNFHFFHSELIDEVEEEFKIFLLQYYQEFKGKIPEEIILNFKNEDILSFSMALNEQLKENIRVKTKSKKIQAIIDMCSYHAEESQKVRLKNQDSVFIGLKKLKELLSLKELPRTLECYDVAIFQGSSPTASQIVYIDGKADKTKYRYYHLETRPEGNNDFAMMREVFIRRLKKGELPDIFIVDGGIAQVNTVREVLNELNIETPVIGIAKARSESNFRQKEVSTSEERLIIHKRSNPYILNKTPSLMKIIVSMRDEAHRFSRKLHHKQEKKRIITSWVDRVRGLGEETKQTILKHLNLSVDELKEMSANEIANSLGINIYKAKLVKNYLQKN